MPDGSPQPNVTVHGKLFVHPPKFWGLLVLTGAGGGLAGGLLMRLLRAIEHLAYNYHAGEMDFLSAVAAVPGSRRVLMLAGAGLIAGVVVSFTHSRKSLRPSGLNRSIWFRSGRLPLLATLIEALLSIVIVGMGVSLGREGALKDTAGAWASQLADWFGLPNDQRRLLVACAAGAGMAAAYNIPLGGALFATEILLGTLSLSYLLPALTASAIATFASWLFLPHEATYQVPVYVLRLGDVLWAALAGPMFGLAAVLWVRTIGLAHRVKLAGWQRMAAPVVVFVLLGATAVAFPDLLGNGKGLVQRAFVNSIDLPLLASLLVLRLIATPACLGSGAPGGVFTPTMTFGALLGGLLGRLWEHLPVVSTHSLTGSQAGVFAMIGSSAVLAASTEAPVSSIVMILELTQHIDAIMVPMLVATAGAALTGRLLESHSVYSVTSEATAGSVTLPAFSSAALAGSRAVRVTAHPRVVSSAAPYAFVLEQLMEPLAAVLVVDDAGTCVGEITHEQLCRNPPREPLDALIAADLARPVRTLGTDASVAEIERALPEMRSAQVPLVDASTDRLRAVVERAKP